MEDMTDMDHYLDESVKPFLHEMMKESAYGTLDNDILRRFYDVYKGVVRHVRETDEWYVYNGRKWVVDYKEATIRRWFADVVKHCMDVNQAKMNEISHLVDIKIKEDTTVREGDTDEAKDKKIRMNEYKAAKAHYERLKDATGIRRRRDLISGLDYFKDLNIESSAFSGNKNLVNFLNGTVDVNILRLKEGKLDRDSLKEAFRRHDPRDMLTQVITYDLDPDAQESGAWLNFVFEIHNSDAELARFVQQSIGYSITGYTSERTFYIQHGGGDNGKSTFDAVMERAFGEYAGQAPIELVLYSTNKSSYEQQIMMNDIRHCRLVIIAEPDLDKTLDAGAIRRLTGGEDKVTARVMRKGYDKFFFEGKVWLFTNNLPNVNDHSISVWKRIAKIPYLTSFADRMDKKLLEKLLKDISYVHVWILEGAAMYVQNGGIAKPHAVEEAVQEYKTDTDILLDFESICFHRTGRADTYVTYVQLISTYKEFCKLTHQDSMKDRVFTGMMKTRGWKQSTTKMNGSSIRIYRGWELIPGWTLPYGRTTGELIALQRDILSLLYKNPGTSHKDICDVLHHCGDEIGTALATLTADGEITAKGDKYYIGKTDATGTLSDPKFSGKDVV